MGLKGKIPESICLQIIQNPISEVSNDNPPRSNIFRPRRERTLSGRTQSFPAAAPEKKLTLFAMRLAILEKVASGLGTLCFVWATVVLLGGFATTLKTKDFWIITAILLTESTRIFSRSHELEWQHRATTTTPATSGSFRANIKASFLSILSKKSRRRRRDNPTTTTDDLATRMWLSSEVPILAFAGWIFSSKNISRIFIYLQLSSVLLCSFLTSMRLHQRDFSLGVYHDDRHLRACLMMFYGLTLAEALVFLMQKTYWAWETDYKYLFHNVCQDCSRGDGSGHRLVDLVSIKRFFYDSYSKCMKGSIFDGLKMDLVTFAEDLLESDSHDEQLRGAQIIQNFVTNERFRSYALRKIGTSAPVIERLIEMLNWTDPAEVEIRTSAALIVNKLAGEKQKAIRVAEIPGALESISSLLRTGQSFAARPHEASPRTVGGVRADYQYSVFNLSGLLILKKLARDHDNCYKIGNAKGLMPRIIDFTSADENLLRNNQAHSEDAYEHIVKRSNQIKTVKRSLHIVKMLVSTTGQTGKMLRKEISEIVYTVSNIREILQHGEGYIELQKLGIEILTNLALDQEAREKIGRTGDVISLLLSIFFKIEDQNAMCVVEAGETLALLALESNSNCKQILKEDKVVGKLIGSLNDPMRKVNSTGILRSLCAYSGPECSLQLKEITAASPTVLKAIMEKKENLLEEEKENLLEESIGLAAQIFRFTTLNGLGEELERGGIQDAEIAKQLVRILKIYKYPDNKVPRIRRFAVELTIWMMRSQKKYIDLFKNLEAEEDFKHVAKTTSELECFNAFSGTIGLCPNNTTLASLIDTALGLMA